jgi:hypothetical protein
VLSALWGSAEAADTYLISITTSRCDRDETLCIDPSLLQLSTTAPDANIHRIFPLPRLSATPTLNPDHLSPGKSNLDTPSIRSTTTEFSSSPQMHVDHATISQSSLPTMGSTCQEQGCSSTVTFKDQKDLDRHFDSVHGIDFFTCRCGKFVARKDNQDRHVRKCRLTSTGPYRCPCGDTTDSAKRHLRHISRRTRNRQTRRFECCSS